MEKKFRKPYDKEYMRMAMLKHEETFKEQVCELHRLYRIQKIMMRNIERNRRPNARSSQEYLWNSKNGFSFNLQNHARDMQQKLIPKLDLESPAENHFAESNNADRVTLELIDESEIQLTLGPSSYNRRKKPDSTPLTSDSGATLSSISTGSSHINRTSYLTHQKINTRREELSSGAPELGLFQVPDVTLGYQNGSNNSIGVEEQLRSERLKQSPWLCQVLSLNMT